MNRFKQKVSEVCQSPYITPVNTIIVACNILLFLIIEITGSTLDTRCMLSWGAVTAEKVVAGKEYYRLLIEMFLHFGMEHLAGNMLLLLIMGSALERNIGTFRYILVYFGSGLTAGVASVAYHWYMGEISMVCAGASGAIFGVVGGIIYLIIENHGFLEEYSMGTMIIFLILNFYTGGNSAGIDIVAHFGGLLAGLIFTFLLCRLTGKGKNRS